MVASKDRDEEIETLDNNGSINEHDWRDSYSMDLFRLVRATKEPGEDTDINMIGAYDHWMGELSLETGLSPRELLALAVDYVIVTTGDNSILPGYPAFSGEDKDFTKYVKERMKDLYRQHFEIDGDVGKWLQ